MLKFNQTNNNQKEGSSNIIIGHSNTFHDPSLAVEYKGELYAEGLERINQDKRNIFSVGLFNNYRSLKTRMKQLHLPSSGKLELTVRSTWNPSWPLRILGKLFNWLYRRVSPRKYRPTLFNDSKSVIPLARYAQTWYMQGRPIFLYQLRNYIFPGQIGKVTHKKTTHHLCHAANAVYTSPFKQCAVMILDGSGEEISCSFYHYKNNKFQLLQTSRPGLGYLYAFITQCCGFSPLHGEEWKVMGLSAYGKLIPDLYQFFKKNIKVKGIRLKVSSKIYRRETIENLAGPLRKDGEDVLLAANLAFTFQKVFTEVVCKIAQGLQTLTGEKSLAYAGGCALNSRANGEILLRTSFEELHVPSAPGDDGNALGALLYEKYMTKKVPQSPFYPSPESSPYLGSEMDLKKLQEILGHGGIYYDYLPEREDLIEKVATLLSHGKIIGWVQGKAEFGPRALGNRSILADPRDPGMKEKINSRIKFREFYRPLAPALCEEDGPLFFENYQHSPYMERTLEFKKGMRPWIPAVVHEDGTGRLQTVSKDRNHLFYDLLQSFKMKTDVGVLVNTSLNVMGRPIVHSVEDALTTFFTTGLDYLVIGNYIIKKSNYEI